MRFIEYSDDTGGKHNYTMQETTYDEIIREFGTIQAWLNSMGIHNLTVTVA